MKKIISLILGLLIVLSSFGAFAASDIRVVLNGNVLDCPTAPMIVNDRTMVPVRVIFEALGLAVNWSEPHQMVYTTTADNKSIVLRIGSNKMYIETNGVGSFVNLDAAPLISSGHTLVPVRAISETAGCTVSWDDNNRCVVIKTADYIEPVTPPVDTENPGNETANPEVQPPSYTPIIDDTPAYINKNNNELAEKLADLINEKRVAEGLPELEYNSALEEVALSHSKDMAANDYISHESPLGLSPFDRLEFANIYYTSAAENLASGFITAEDVLNSWMNSPSHRDNIMNFEFTQIGIGYYYGGSNGTYWTLLLISE